MSRSWDYLEGVLAVLGQSGATIETLDSGATISVMRWGPLSYSWTSYRSSDGKRYANGDAWTRRGARRAAIKQARVWEKELARAWAEEMMGQ